MTRSPLRTEQRMDRNGKLVTRHVKADAAAGATRHLPPPAAARADDTEKRRKEELISEVHARLPGMYPGRDILLLGLQMDTIESLRSAVDQGPAVRECLTEMINHGKVSDPDYDENIVRLCVLSIPFAVDLHSCQEPAAHPMVIAQSLSGGTMLCGFDERPERLGDEEARTVKAYYFAHTVKLKPHDKPNMVRRFVERLDEIERWAPAFGAAYQKESPDSGEDDIYAALAALHGSDLDPHRLGDFIRDRDLTDVRAAAEAIRGVTAPLQDGAL